MDNGHGRGYLGGVQDDTGQTVFVISGNCPLHGDDAMKRVREERK